METYWKSLIASTVMAMAVAGIQTHHYNKFYLPIYVIIGGAIYLAMLRLTNAIRPEDVRLMKEYLGSRFSSVIPPLEKLLVGS